jgi:hypothetical protein
MACVSDIVSIIIGAVISGGCTSNPSHPAAPSDGRMDNIITISEIIEAMTDLNKI